MVVSGGKHPLYTEGEEIIIKSLTLAYRLDDTQQTYLAKLKSLQWNLPVKLSLYENSFR